MLEHKKDEEGISTKTQSGFRGRESCCRAQGEGRMRRGDVCTEGQSMGSVKGLHKEGRRDMRRASLDEVTKAPTW